MPTTWTDSQPVPGRPAPQLGEHSLEILKELGYSSAEVKALIQQGVTLVPSTEASA